MKLFKVNFTERINQSVVIEAKNREEAEKKFYNWNFDDKRIKEEDSKIDEEDGINIIELKRLGK